LVGEEGKRDIEKGKVQITLLPRAWVGVGVVGIVGMEVWLERESGGEIEREK
jgi:hypothetical protein